jgi:hypothetical protein
MAIALVSGEYAKTPFWLGSVTAIAFPVVPLAAVKVPLM